MSKASDRLRKARNQQAWRDRKKAATNEAVTQKFIPYPDRLPAHLKAYWDKRGPYFHLYLADSPEYGTYEDFLQDLTDCYDRDPKK